MRADFWSLMILVGLSLPAQAQTVSVPFVGCPSDGQLGPQPAPARASRTPKVAAAVAPRLAWYASKDIGVLAPRGWHCFGLYGSNGAFLMVTPEDHSRNAFGARLTGLAVQVSGSVGDTSGRFEAARVAARLFPGRRAFVQGVIAEGLEPASAFPFGPFPQDRVQRLDKNTVMFETPANRDGLGTMSRLVKSDQPIRGLAVMDADNDATVLSIRLGPYGTDLASAIIAAERAARPGP